MAKLSRVICKVVVFDDLNNVLVIKRSMDDDWSPGEWEVPGGKADDDEDFVAAAARELHEETGIKIAHTDLHIVSADVTYGDDGINRVWLFFAGRSASEKVTISEEHSGYQWLAQQEARDIVENESTKKVLSHIEQYALLP